MSNHLKGQEISIYLEGRASAIELKKIEEHLRTCSDCFQAYMNMREAVFLQKSGEQISTKMRESLLKRIRTEDHNHISIIVRFLRDKVVVFSGDQRTLRVQGLKATYAFRSEKDSSVSNSHEGPISITRTILGREVILTIHPVAQTDKMGLSLLIRPSEALGATVSFDGDICETIVDISKQSMLATQLPRQGELDINFFKDNTTIFTITLSLEAGE